MHYQVNGFEDNLQTKFYCHILVLCQLDIIEIC